jgi:hypothetical protein
VCVCVFVCLRVCMSACQCSTAAAAATITHSPVHEGYATPAAAKTNNTTAGVASGTEGACPWLAQCGEWMATDSVGDAKQTLASRLAGFGIASRQSTYLEVEPGPARFERLEMLSACTF